MANSLSVDVLMARQACCLSEQGRIINSLCCRLLFTPKASSTTQTVLMLWFWIFEYDGLLYIKCMTEIAECVKADFFFKIYIFMQLRRSPIYLESAEDQELHSRVSSCWNWSISSNWISTCQDQSALKWPPPSCWQKLR